MSMDADSCSAVKIGHFHGIPAFAFITFFCRTASSLSGKYNVISDPGYSLSKT